MARMERLGARLHGRRRRVLTGTLALGALSLVAAGSALPAASVMATDDARGGTAIVECRSGIVTDGDVQTSSMSVTRVDAAHVPDLPGGCSVTP